MAVVETPPQSFTATGRRKSAVARVRIREGSGTFTVNRRPVDEYFVLDHDRKTVRNPLVASELADKVDCIVDVKGGGISGQAGAVMLGIGRALSQMRPDLEHMLRENGFLTRDGRMKERKKYGRKGARKSFQFSKR